MQRALDDAARIVRLAHCLRAHQGTFCFAFNASSGTYWIGSGQRQFMGLTLSQAIDAFLEGKDV